MLSIKQRQLNLRTYYYYYKKSVDGIEGAGTKEAYKNFQRDNGLAVDGIYGSNTDNKLILCIRDLQNLLNKYGYNLAVDGIVGNATLNAIKDFQSKNGLGVDGIAGTQTMNKLRNGGGSSTLTWDDIKTFKKSEFDCPCCGKNNIDLRLVKILEDYFRNYYNAPTIITSGCRCQKYNNSLTGSVKGSRHIDGAAADFYVKGISVNEFYARAKELQAKGIIKYTYTNNSNMRGAIHINI